jgi:drug/metabolite transporter (DMT)-like permease
MQAEKRAYLELHIAVFLFGFTAILGDLIQLSALVLVWWRVMITSFSLVFLIRPIQLFRSLGGGMILRFMGIGVLVAMHWLAFYGAIKLSNASIALVAMATTSFFTSLLEPWLLAKRVNWLEIGLGLLIIPGMVLVANSTSLGMVTGLWVGLLAALLAAFFAILNKKYIGAANEMSITFLELGSAWIFLSLVIPLYGGYRGELPVIGPPTWTDVGYILILSLLCTTLAYVLALRSLRHLSAFASNLTVNLEPVYGIALAWVLLQENEELGPGFYWGVLIILLVVFSYPLLRRWTRRRGKTRDAQA